MDASVTSRSLIVSDTKISHLTRAFLAGEKRRTCDKKVRARKLYLADADALI